MADLKPFSGALDPVGTAPAPSGLQPFTGRLDGRARGPIGEIANQLYAGAVVDLPAMAGRALQYTSNPGAAVYEVGKGITEAAETRGQRPDLQPEPEQHNVVTNALASGARMIPQSIVPAAAVGAGLATLPISGPAALAGAAVLGAVPAGMAQAQDTLERGRQAGLPEQDALDAARKTGLIETGGEALGTYAGGKLLALGGKPFSTMLNRALGRATGTPAEQALGDATVGKALKPWLKQLPETAAVEVGTEMGQNAAQAAVERNAGIAGESPMDAATAAIAPTLGMTALLAPFGLAGHTLRARAITRRADTLASGQADQQARAEAADQVAAMIGEADPQAAQSFKQHAAAAILDGQDLQLGAELLQPYQEPAAAEPAPQLGYQPDPIVVFPDGTAGRRSEIDAYIAALPEDQQIAARAQLEGLGAQPAGITTSPGAQPPRPAAAPAPLVAPNWTSAPGAQPSTDAIPFQRDVDTGGLQLVDQQEEARQRAATVDFQAPDLTPGWETQPGAAPPRAGLDMPARQIDTGSLALAQQAGQQRPSLAMGLDPALGPLTSIAADAVDGGATSIVLANRQSQADAEAQAKGKAAPAGKAPAPVGSPAAAPATGVPGAGPATAQAPAVGAPNAQPAPTLGSVEPAVDAPAAQAVPAAAQPAPAPGVQPAAGGAAVAPAGPAGQSAAGVALPDGRFATAAAELAALRGAVGEAPDAGGALPVQAVALSAAGRSASAALEGAGSPAAARKPLAVGRTPNATEPVTVRDGVVHIGRYEALNFESGEPVRVPVGATEDQVKKALRDAGVLTRKQRFFGGEADAAAPQPATSPAAGAPAAPAELQPRKTIAAQRRDKRAAQKTIPQQRKEARDARGTVPAQRRAAQAVAQQEQGEQPGREGEQAAPPADDGAQFRATAAPAPRRAAPQQGIEAEVSRVTRDWLRKPAVHVIESMEEAPAPVLRQWASQQELDAQGEPEGFHYKGEVYLLASQMRSDADVRRVLFHEALGHFGLRGVFGKRLNPMLAQLARQRPKEIERKAELYGFDLSNRNHVLAAAEEVLAELAQTRPELPIVQRVVAAIRTWLREHGLLRGAMTDAEIIRTYILPARGWVERGRAELPGASDDAQFSRGEDRTIEVDGVRRPIENSAGQPIVPPSQGTQALLNFWRWFGDSKVVDEQGRPMVLYHGTTGNVTAFDPGRAGQEKQSDWGGGIYFTPSPSTADYYRGEASKRVDTESERLWALMEDEEKKTTWSNGSPTYTDEHGRLMKEWRAARAKAKDRAGSVMPVYVSIKNPLVQEYSNLPDPFLSDRAKEAGRDGIIVLNGNGDFDEIVAFLPEQIKSATGNAGTFDPADPDVRFSVGNVRKRTYTPGQEAAMRKTGMLVDPVPLADRARALFKDAGKKLTQGIADQFHPIREIDRTAYNLLRLSKGASGAFEVFLRGGQLKLTDNVYDFDDTKKGGVVDRLLLPLQGEHHDFLRWVAANRAEQLSKEDREHLFTGQDIAALKTLADGKLEFDYKLQHGARAGQVTRDRTEAYRDSLRTFNEFHKNALDMAEQSGLIDGASRPFWEKEFYVPFFRAFDDGVRGMNIKSGVVRQQAFKALKGGTQHLNADLLENTLMNWAHLLDAAAKNRAAKATLEALQNTGNATEATEDVARQMAKAAGKTDGVVWFMDQGVKRHFVVDDPYLLQAVSALEYAGFNSPAMKALGAFKHALTLGVTYSPFFKIRNLIRDSMQAVASGPLSYNVGKNLKDGWQATDPASEAFMRLLAGGGTIHFGTMMEGSEAKRVQSLVEAGVDRATILDSEGAVKAFYRKAVAPALRAYEALGDRGEAINRAALYKQLRSQGMDHAEASLQARDLMDFSMQGSWNTVRFLTQVVPFMNARIQGLYKLGRAAKEDPARFSAVLGATALFSLGLLAAWHDDDDWKKREDWDRNNYWWFKLGGTAFRIPKPFEIGAIATLAERGAEWAFEDEMTSKRFRENVLALLGDNLAMNPVPQLVKPMLDVYANVDSFSGRPVESMGMEKLKADYRFDQRTSMAARAASTGLNAVTGLVGKESLSPVQIDHLVRGYFGWLGSFVVGAGDVLTRDITGQPDKPAPDYWKTATGGMVAQTEGASSRYVSQMYRQAKEIEQAYGTWRQLVREGKVQEAQAFREDNAAELARYHRMEQVKRIESALNLQVKRIEAGPGTPQEKRDEILRLRDRQDAAARPVAQ